MSLLVGGEGGRGMTRLNQEILRKALAERPALMSRKAAAHRIGVSERSIDRWVRDGRLRGVRIGSRVFVASDSVEALIASDAFAQGDEASA
jgi:excisionase family DNA binding protein